MIKDKFKEIVKTGIQPPLKAAGFKKFGNHFIKINDETQQVVTLQLSHGNSYERLRFYFRCGILINGLKPEHRELKSEVNADYRLGINKITDEFMNDYFDLTNDTQIDSIAEKLKKVIKTDLIPFFSRLENEENCIDYITSRDSLQGDYMLIRYLCSKNLTDKLEKYVIRLVKFLKSIKDQYSDPNTARMSVDKMISLIEESNCMTPELRKEIEKSW